MKLSQLSALVAVVDAGGFTNAVEVTGTSQSAISHAVATLEKELGVQLLLRERQNLQLTVTGKQVLQHAREMLQHEQAIRSLATGFHPMVGKVRVGSLPSTTFNLLPRAMKELKKDHPELDIVFFEGNNTQIQEWIQDGTVDVGIVELPLSRLSVLPLVEDELLVLLPAQSPLAELPLITPIDLAAEPFIMSKYGCEPLIREAFASAGCAPNVTQGVSDMGTLELMVAEGLGVSIVPALALRKNPPSLAAKSLSPRLFRQLGLALPDAGGTQGVQLLCQTLVKLVLRA